jgi:signal transduction histidine kinase
VTTPQRSARPTRWPVLTARRPVPPPGRRVLTVQGWFRVVFAVLAVLAVAAVVIVVSLLAAGRQASGDLENNILPAQAQAYRLQGALLDQETGVRGYAITGRKDFLQPYTAGLVTEAAAVRQLRQLIGGNRLLSADLARVEAAANSWRRLYARPLIALASRGPLGPRDLAMLDRSKASFDHLRALFATQNAHLAAAAARDSARVHRIRSVDNWVLALVVAAFVLAAAALMLILRRAVVQPLDRLRDATRQVVDGDFDHRIEVTGPADLRAVTSDVEAMRSELVAALEDARASQAELLRSNAELEQFAYVASHDLQEPLRKVASFCQLLEKRYGDRLDERGRQYIDFAVDGAKRLQVLINDLLTFSRVGRADQIRVRLPLDAPLDAAITALQAAVEESGAVIERPGPLPEVLGDATLLTMLWQNLIGNGIKFRAPDRSPRIRITASGPSEDMWQFCVEDNGIGIPPEFAEKVFIIFQRLHGRDAYPGTGIGLAICKRIVEHHGGQIHLDSGYTGGTRICFTLPRIAPAEPAGLGENSNTSSASTEGICA